MDQGEQTEISIMDKSADNLLVVNSQSQCRIRIVRWSRSLPSSVLCVMTRPCGKSTRWSCCLSRSCRRRSWSSWKTGNGRSQKVGECCVAQESSQKAPFLPIQSNNQPRLLTILSSIYHSRLLWADGVYTLVVVSTKNVFKKLHHQNLRGSQTLVLEWEAGAAHQGERDDG